MTKKTLGYAMASYFGGRADVRVRGVPVPVTVVDFTSMYPTVFILQNLQATVGAPNIRCRVATKETRAFLASVTPEDLYELDTWCMLNRIVLVRPKGDILPVRMRMNAADPFTIAVTHFTSDHPRWYTLADLVAAKLLGGTVPHIEKAIAFEPSGDDPQLRGLDFLGTTLDPATQIMATVIEERQRAKRAGANDPGAVRRELALKVLGVSAGYGIFAEINVTLDPAGSSQIARGRAPKPSQGVWYSDVGPMPGEVHDERPGRFFSPIVASLVTGGARLMLAMAEAEVAARGGTFAFCDTDSLAIVAGETGPQDVPRLSPKAVAEVIDGFNRLNPYDPTVVPHLLKREYAEVADAHCYAVSAKRYVLYTRDQRNRLRIVKASESGIGAVLGRTSGETVPKLARRFWTAILIRELGLRYTGTRKRGLAKLLAFDVPLRRKLPIAQPSVLDARGFRKFNRTKSYDFQIKPFGFLQTVTPAVQMGATDVRPIAPYERDLAKSRKLPWTDLDSGKVARLDWSGDAHSGTIPVMRMDEILERYARHPESKAAGPDGQPAGPQTRGVLGRLHLCDGEPVRIGKEVDRLDEDQDDSLDWPQPDAYATADDPKLAWALGTLGARAGTRLAGTLRVSERRLRDVLKGRSKPRRDLRRRIIDAARKQGICES